MHYRYFLPHLQINPLDPHHRPFRMHHHSRVHLLHHAVLWKEPHCLAYLRPSSPAYRPLEG
jgi:hypothetical protein